MRRKSIDHLRSASSRSTRLGERADEPGADAGTAEEDGAGGAVVGAAPAVLGHAAAELAEGHQQNAVGQAGGSEVFLKRKQGCRQVAQQVVMGPELIMCVS